ncbi:MAG: hypothetical protein OXD01_14615 [Gammaproteobacteria bacterium]|nr:hypothetical protein [Gammaproteobacteria bacterium]
MLAPVSVRVRGFTGLPLRLRRGVAVNRFAVIAHTFGKIRE